MTRHEMLRRMDSAEIAEWMAYHALSPFGTETQYVGPAITTSTLVNLISGIFGGSGSTEPADFMPKNSSNENGQSMEEMMQLVEIMNAAMGGKDLRQDLEDDDG